jgi:hypothetical protein
MDLGTMGRSRRTHKTSRTRRSGSGIVRDRLMDIVSIRASSNVSDLCVVTYGNWRNFSNFLLRNRHVHGKDLVMSYHTLMYVIR